MKKYDCSRTLDYVHEATRLCTVYTKSKCEGCPLGDTVDCAFVGDITPEHIDILQKWSDEHPEQPKLTKREYEFLSAFTSNIEGKAILRNNMGTWLDFVGINNTVMSHRIDDNMFPFISDDEVWYFDKLLKLDVEE